MEDLSSPSPIHHSKHPIIVGICVGLVVLLLLVAVGWLVWQLKACHDQAADKEGKNASLQSRVDDLTKKLADAQKNAASVKNSAASTNSSTASSCGTQVIVSQSTKDTIAAAIRSKNTAALAGYMTSSVRVAVAGSDKTGAETAAQAVNDLDFLNNATGAWNFTLSAATLNTFKTGAYEAYFSATSYVGEADSGQVGSFDFDACGKINSVFMSVNANLLG